ncbi:PREDICTED: LYR motif-containing protein 4 isoform X1 [Ficedula albicollis]|uniref:LYR motif-containing protein 4 isoform X1 n=1 Tax=Ficedula albicollis TaxID=59894 RepID=UPI0007AD8344|nr:PREDICTED: LYR motif-containing protein 4 isoform X1 [Ficedula albicollis]
MAASSRAQVLRLYRALLRESQRFGSYNYRESWNTELSNSLKIAAPFSCGNFNLPDVCWEYNATERKESRRFLECVEDKFLMQLVREPDREGTPLDLLFAKRKGVLCDEKIGGRLGHSSPEMTELAILAEVRRRISTTDPPWTSRGQIWAC